MSGLLDHLRSQISQTGPVTVARYMDEALVNPRWGYYRNRDPLGRGGDFITAPEMSQMFGELIGLWCAVLWQSMGQPAPLRLVELGPGRGTLMVDLLRAARSVEGFIDALDVHLVETSPVLRQCQTEALGQRATWHDSFDQVPGGPLLLVANEFFDALPVRQFEKRDGAWHERLVDIDPGSGGLRFVLGSPGPLPEVPGNGTDGDIFEVSSTSLVITESIGARLAATGGAALVIDYGHARSGFGDTLQAVKAHEYHPALESPGEADLTAHVDFEALGQAFRQGGARTFAPLGQGAFLEGLDIGARTEMLAQAATPDQAETLQTTLSRLTAADAMGALFKVLAAVHPGLPAPPPFA